MSAGNSDAEAEVEESELGEFGPDTWLAEIIRELECDGNIDLAVECALLRSMFYNVPDNSNADELQNHTEKKRADGRMTLIEKSVPLIFKPNLGINDSSTIVKIEENELTMLLRGLTPAQREEYLMARQKAEQVSSESKEEYAIRVRSDLRDLQGKIARMEIMLKAFSLTEENRREMESKLADWVALLNRHLEGPMTNMEKHLEDRRLEEKMTFFRQNKGLTDVFDLYWYLVLPHCITGEDGEPYLPKKGYLLFNANLYIALTGTKDSEKYLQHARINWQGDTREIIVDGKVDESYIPPRGVEVVPAPDTYELPEDTMITCISKEKFFLSVFHVLDTWAELMSPQYYSVFAWSILESIGDTTRYPPVLRLPSQVTCCTRLEREMAMTISFSNAQKLRNFLCVPSENLSRIPEVLARLAARKKGTTISKEDSTRIRMVYDKLRKDGKLYSADGETDSDGSAPHGAKKNSRFGNDGEFSDGDLNNDSGDESNEDSEEKRKKRAEIESRRLALSDMDVKKTFAANAKQRTKFVKDDSKDMRTQKRSSGKNSMQKKHIEYLNYSSKPTATGISDLVKAEREQKAASSPVVSSFRGPDGQVLTHWQYGSATIPAADLLDTGDDQQDMDMFKQNFLKKGAGNWRVEYLKMKYSTAADQLFKVSPVAAAMSERKANWADRFRAMKQSAANHFPGTTFAGDLLQPEDAIFDEASVSLQSSQKSVVTIPSVVSFKNNDEHDGGINDLKATRAREKRRFTEVVMEGKSAVSTMRDSLTTQTQIQTQTLSSELVSDPRKNAGKNEGNDKEISMPVTSKNAATQLRPLSRDAGNDRQTPSVDKVKKKGTNESSQIQPVDIVRRMLLKRVRGLESLGLTHTHLSRENGNYVAEESKQPNHDLFEDSRDIDVSLEDVVYTEQGLMPPKVQQGVHEPQTDIADMWYKPLDLSLFAASNILAGTQSGSLTSADHIGIGSLSLWTEGFTAQDTSLHGASHDHVNAVVDFDKEQRRTERMERKRARAAKREKRRAERTYRLGNLEDDVLRVRADFMRSFRSQ